MFVLEIHNIILIEWFFLIRFLARFFKKAHVELGGGIDFFSAINDILNSFQEFLVLFSLGQLIMKAIVS